MTEREPKTGNPWDTYDGVKKGVEDMGFAPRVEPEYPCPELTADKLTTPDSRSYTETYSELLAWWGFSAERLANIKAELLQVKNEMDWIASSIRQEMRSVTGKKPPAADIDDAIKVDEKHTTLKIQEQALTQYKDMLSIRVEGIEKSLKVISRQVEIRRLDHEQHGTQHNMPGRNRRPLS